ncbi:proline-rich protein 7 isoform X3 [Zonotrichia leucophrys gambelii]|uniref:proline-rich protein 7 isoform X3 n=1 Tax=Zonotrichia leucophrys gambelii TaxID=257770 RepID=UPI00314065BF
MAGSSPRPDREPLPGNPRPPPVGLPRPPPGMPRPSRHRHPAAVPPGPERGIPSAVPEPSRWPPSGGGSRGGGCGEPADPSPSRGRGGAAGREPGRAGRRAAAARERSPETKAAPGGGGGAAHRARTGPPPPPPDGAAARRLSHVRRRRRYLRRRVKRQQEERLREQSLRALEMEPLHYEGYGGSPPGIAIPHRLRLEPHHHHHHPHHIPPPRPWSCRHESDLSKPPCYEEALLMAEPPPPYSEVLMDTRGLYRKINAPFLSHERLEKQEQPPSYKPLFLDAGYGSALHLPRSASPGPACPDLYLQQECSPRMFPSWTDSELSSRDTYETGPWHLPVSMPLFGRTTAV